MALGKAHITKREQDKVLNIDWNSKHKDLQQLLYFKNECYNMSDKIIENKYLIQ